MKNTDDSPAYDREIADQAATWVIRQERGLSADEQDALSQWLGQDARHRAAWAEQRWNWDELDRLAGLQASVAAVPDRHLLAPRRRSLSRWLGFAAVPLAIAAVIAIAVQWHATDTPGPRAPQPIALIPPCEQRQLDDGSVVELNRGASIAVAFTRGERRLRLERGEAHFSVAHDASRPFVVDAAGIAVQAVGTEFTVTLEPERVAVLVTDGKVRVESRDDPAGTGSAPGPIVAAGQRALIARGPVLSSPQVSAVSAEQIQEQLAWKPRLLDFSESTFEEIAREFNRHNPVKMTLGDASLATRRLSGTFRSDNVQAFVHLLESDFGVRVTRPSPDEIVLWMAK
jgi:transmembrane sensor